MPIIDTPITANAASLDRVMETPLPKILIFYNSQNGGLPGPLEQMMKTIAKASAEQLLITKIDLAENPDLKTRYQISSSPVMIAVKDGQDVARSDQPDAVLLQQYADYLMGRSSQLPKPEARPQPAAAQAGGTSKPVAVTDASFTRDVLESDIPVLVDFWAAWCGPCRMIAPSLEKLASEFSGKVKIAKLNVDENRSTSMQYQIRGIPALKLFKNGRVVDELVGAAPEHMLRQFIQKHI